MCKVHVVVLFPNILKRLFYQEKVERLALSTIHRDVKMVVAHDGIVDVFVDAECGHGGFPFSPVCGQKKTQRPRLSGNAAFRQRSLL